MKTLIGLSEKTRLILFIVFLFLIFLQTVIALSVEVELNKKMYKDDPNFELA